MKGLYLLINLAAVLVPLVYSFHPRIRFDRHFKYAFPAIILAAIPFLIWDNIFTNQGHWGFNPDYVTGLYIGKLPIEEILFFFCIPFCCLFTYYCITRFIYFSFSSTVISVVTIILSIALAFIAWRFMDRAYTAVTFGILSVFLMGVQFLYKRTDLGPVMAVWGVLLIPFMLVNGILTGLFLPEPVVWYNNAENLGYRLLTIPVEDVFYGFLLFVLVVVLYERFRGSDRSHISSETTL